MRTFFVLNCSKMINGFSCAILWSGREEKTLISLEMVQRFILLLKTFLSIIIYLTSKHYSERFSCNRLMNLNRISCRELWKGMSRILSLLLWSAANFGANFFRFFWSDERFLLRSFHLPNDDWRRNSSLSSIFSWCNIWILDGVDHSVHEILSCLNQRCSTVESWYNQFARNILNISFDLWCDLNLMAVESDSL